MGWEKWRSATPEGRLICLISTVTWLAAVVAAARFLDLGEPYLPFAIAGGLIFYLRNSPPAKEQIVWLLLSAGFGFLVRFPHINNWIIQASSVLALGGFGAFLMLGIRWIWSESSARRQVFAMLAPAAGIVFFVFSAQRALSFANLLYPRTYDLYLFVVDGSLGFQPSFLAGRAMFAAPLFRVICLLAYMSLPFVMALVYALRLPKNCEHASWDFIVLLMMAGIGGWALYNVVPATGPAYVFGPAFPWQSLPYSALSKLFLEQIPVRAEAPRNAIPSLHMAWVILLYWSSKGFSRGLRAFLAIYLALTVISTLGTGEHYFVDLVAGVPFALFIWALVSPGMKVSVMWRIGVAASGLAMTVAWLLLVRMGAKWMLVSPVLPWMLIIATITGVWAISWNYHAAESSQNIHPARANDFPQAKASAAGAGF